jgi:enterochelin esterase-like enzyme
MDLTGLPFLLLLIAAGATLLAGTMLLWNRWPGRWAFPMRLLCLLLVMAAGAVLAADVVNRTYGFYASLDDLLGRLPAPRGMVAGPVPERGVPDGRAIRVRLPGTRAGVSREGLVYLPAAYFQRSAAGQRFPVLELFHGFPGGPDNWIRQLHLPQVLDAEIAAGRLPPVVAVIPTDDEPGRDSECVNAVGGQQDETYLAVDVPADVRREFRALDTPGSWATLGYSTGGFCAVNLALHHPNRYAAAASLSGYYDAIVDESTGDLYEGNAAARRWNSPQWLVTHRRTTVPLFLAASRGDLEAMRAMQAMRHAAQGRSPLATLTLPTGGHNFRVWYAASLAAFQWLGAHLPHPAAPDQAGARTRRCACCPAAVWCRSSSASAANQAETPSTKLRSSRPTPGSAVVSGNSANASPVVTTAATWPKRPRRRRPLSNQSRLPSAAMLAMAATTPVTLDTVWGSRS